MTSSLDHGLAARASVAGGSGSGSRTRVGGARGSRPRWRAARAAARRPRRGGRGASGWGLAASSCRRGRPRNGEYPLLATLPRSVPRMARRPLVPGGPRRALPLRGRRDGQRHRDARMVVALAQAGMLGFFGAAGPRLDRVERALDEIERALGDRAACPGVNLIHSPNEPDLEDAVADLSCAAASAADRASAPSWPDPRRRRYARPGCGRPAGPDRAAAPRLRQGLPRRGARRVHVAAAREMLRLAGRAPAAHAAEAELAARCPWPRT